MLYYSTIAALEGAEGLGAGEKSTELDMAMAASIQAIEDYKMRKSVARCCLANRARSSCNNRDSARVSTPDFRASLVAFSTSATWCDHSQEFTTRWGAVRRLVSGEQGRVHEFNLAADCGGKHWSPNAVPGGHSPDPGLLSLLNTPHRR